MTMTTPAPLQAHPVRPPLRYYGSKWRLAPWIISFFPPHRLYVEPFAGGAAVLLRKPESELEVYNDADGQIVNFFRVLRERPDDLQAALDLTPFAWAEHDDALRHPDAGDDLEQARRLYVRSWQSRGGARGDMRAGWRRAVDVTHTARAVEEWTRPDRLHAVAARLRRVQFECDDALAVIRRYDQPDALFYVDPPYLAATRGRWKDKGYAVEMTEADHVALAATLHSIRGAALITHYLCPLYLDLYADWQLHTAQTTTDGGYARTEGLWLSPRVANAPVQGSLLETL